MKYIALLLLSGCAIFPPDYQWTKAFPAAKSHVWVVKAKADVALICGLPLSWPAMACVPLPLGEPCRVYSNISEDEARHIFTGGGDDTPMLREHELKHCDGWVHQQLGRT